MVSVTSLFLVVGLALHLCAAQKVHREKHKTLFVKGNLGKVSQVSGQSLLPEDVKVAATSAIMNLLVQFANATGTEDVRPTDDEVFVDAVAKNRHIRFQQYVDGLPLQRASLMLHTKGDTVFAFNGEFTPSYRVRTGMTLDCEEAMAVALAQFSGEGGDPEPKSTCTVAAVRGDDGVAHKGYEQTFSFGKAGSVVLYASGQTGAFVAMNRLESFARSITTKDFRSNNNLSWVISTSSNGIYTGVDRFDGAHNNTALTYDFYNETYKRDSIDGRGLRLVINVDYTPMGPFTTDIAAYHSGMKQVYVAPEGELYYSMATSLDVVAHEVGTASD
jgi:Zn-dependent metalloprotease